MTKICKICLIEKPLDEFHRDYQRKDKRNSRCKICWRAYLNEPYRVEQAGLRVESYKTNPRWQKRMKEYQRRYREKKKLEKQERLYGQTNSLSNNA